MVWIVDFFEWMAKFLQKNAKAYFPLFFLIGLPSWVISYAFPAFPDLQRVFRGIAIVCLIFGLVLPIIVAVWVFGRWLVRKYIKP